MKELSTLIESEQDELLSTIDGFQADIVKSFLVSTSNDYLKSADYWLNASTANTAKFGGEPNKTKIYRDKLLEELEKFICGDAQYEDDRKKIGESADKSQKYIIGVFIAPVIVLLILSIGKMAVNAWCAMRKEERSTAGNNV
jgi:hypothetical protein